jgi:hypothetical protein
VLRPLLTLLTYRLCPTVTLSYHEHGGYYMFEYSRYTTVPQHPSEHWQLSTSLRSPRKPHPTSVRTNDPPRFHLLKRNLPAFDLSTEPNFPNTGLNTRTIRSSYSREEPLSSSPVSSPPLWSCTSSRPSLTRSTGVLTTAARRSRDPWKPRELPPLSGLARDLQNKVRHLQYPCGTH